MGFDIRIKRAYSAAELKDGYRILVDRLWPRGVPKAGLQVELWLKDIAPSGELRKWFDHDPRKWAEFKRRYHCELRGKGELLSTIAELEVPVVTFVYAAKEERFNNAVALKLFFEESR